MDDVEITVLGSFSVAGPRALADPSGWSRRAAADLVKLLAVVDGRTLHREQVLDALWPDVPPDAALPRLHKAAHYARRDLGDPRAVVLRRDLVQLLPDAAVRVDAVEFRDAARRALDVGTPAAAESTLAAYAGPFLPGDLYEPWTTEWREQVQQLHRALLRQAGRWAELVAEDPAEEEAHLALARDLAGRGDVRGALRQLERLEHAVRGELGTAPGPDVRRLREELTARLPAAAVPAPTSNRLVGRRRHAQVLRARLDAADAGHGGMVLVSGVAGVGKSALLQLALTTAGRRGWRTGRGAASSMEGGWPYAPVLEALGDLCRRHPALLDGLAEVYRRELERALAGEQASWTGETSHQRLFVAAAELLRLAAGAHGVLLVVDDLHEADEASLRLLHYLARAAVTERAVLAVAARPAPRLHALRTSVHARGAGAVLDVAPLDEQSTRRLVADRVPDLDEAQVSEVVAVSGGIPFRALEAARAAGEGAAAPVVTALPAPHLAVLQRVALLGAEFSTDELVGVGGVAEDQAYDALAAALAAASSSRARPATGSATRWCASRCSPPSPSRSGPAPGAWSPTLWSGSTRRRPASPTSTWRPAYPGRPCRTCSAPSTPPARSAPTATGWPSSTR